MFKHKLTKPLGLLLLLILLLLIPLLAKGGYVCHVFIMIFLNIIFATSLGLIFKMGYLSLGHAAFVLAGAYTSAVLTTRLGWSFWPSIILAGVTPGILALVIGRILLRLKGIYFCITTFSFCEVLRALCLKSKNLLGGPQGIFGIPSPELSLFGLKVQLSTMFSYYYFVLVVAVITIFILYRLTNSRLGLTWDAIKQEEILAECEGVNTTRYKILNFVVACFFAGIGGSLLAHYVAFISPFSFTFWQSTYYVFYCVVGGPGILGPMLGASMFTAIGEYLYGFGTWASIIFGTILILSLIFLPDGLISLPQRVAAISQRMWGGNGVIRNQGTD